MKWRTFFSRELFNRKKQNKSSTTIAQKNRTDYGKVIYVDFAKGTGDSQGEDVNVGEAKRRI